MANGDPYGIDPVVCCAAGICCRNATDRRKAVIKLFSEMYADDPTLSREQRDAQALRVAEFLDAKHLVVMPMYVSAAFRFMASPQQQTQQPARLAHGDIP